MLSLNYDCSLNVISFKVWRYNFEFLERCTTCMCTTNNCCWTWWKTELKIHVEWYIFPLQCVHIVILFEPMISFDQFDMICIHFSEMVLEFQISHEKLLYKIYWRENVFNSWMVQMNLWHLNCIWWCWKHAFRHPPPCTSNFKCKCLYRAVAENMENQHDFRPFIYIPSSMWNQLFFFSFLLGV